MTCFLRGQANALFDELDGDANGRIDADELRAQFGMLAAERMGEFAAFFEGLDADADGGLSREEFDTFWRRV